ncbi:MAG: NAD(P)-binding domain-containing protein [Gemmatimonadota bacterium]|nr:NAD(P)-binding domain-containing protein [Gemmatimonadota bacterium]
MTRVLVDLASTRPVWSAPPAVLRAVRRAGGRGWTVVPVRARASSDGDGGAGSAAAVRAAAGAEVYIGWGVPSSVVAAAHGTLRWAHTAAAGVGASITPVFRATGARLTNSRGVHAEPIADWVVAAIGFCLRGFHDVVAAQRERRWAKDVFTDGTVSVREFAGTRVGLIGLGGIGRAVARRCQALGMPVSAVRRTPTRRPPRGVQWVGGPDELVALARRSDVLVVAAPHTTRTRQLVNRRVLAALPTGAYVINVARGEVMDEAALLAALDRRLGGAVLDVFDREPLPRTHPLWTHPRVLVSPHVSGVTDRFWERETALIVDNVRRYRSGRRLRNLVNLDREY